ncbi:hypothetical protein [Caulobacter mirabilis]|uniref:Lipoprotein n=1 Tax=Caulobacter mirabilis TaxID=69666 RepID=A0A2D2B3R6_9CAUL|nr:hypothetical protein [Caulobacter mirabilis]ATQ44846.1 hypothetical protein CSW64_02535 [Caulobacter mirabilis]
MRAQAFGRYGLFALAALSVLALTACAAQPPGTPGTPAFWAGLGHGLIAPIAFVVSLFNDDVRMYAFPNAGRWYDFGFLIGLSFWGGGGAAAAKR